MLRRPPRSTLDRSSAASDVYKRQEQDSLAVVILPLYHPAAALYNGGMRQTLLDDFAPVSYTHLRAHETVLDLVCRLLLEKKKLITTIQQTPTITSFS